MTSEPRRDPWRESVVRAAEEARQLEPLATVLFVFAVALYVVNVLWPLVHAGGVREMGLRLVAAMPAAVVIVEIGRASCRERV